MNRLTVKTSTIFIAKGGRTKVYHSVQEVPPRLRKQLEESTNSFNSATILIADRRGKEEILKALNGLPASLRSRLAMSLATQPLNQPDLKSDRLGLRSRMARFLRHNWLEISLPTAVSVIIWIAFNYR
jgi:hypothetical protein